MKKKVLFMIINMNIGGTEKALLNMINEMPNDKYEITILMLEEYGGFLEYIPKWVDVKYVHNYDLIKSTLNNSPLSIIVEAFKCKKIIFGLLLFLLYIMTKITKERSLIYKFLLRSYPIDPIKYDVAVAYAGPMDFISYFILKKVTAKKKYQWIHFDITKIGFNINFASKYYQKFNNVFVVSEDGKEKLLSLMPKIVNKVDVFKNVISTNQINSMANKCKGFKDKFNGLRILTVGRLSKEKGQDLTIPVLARLKKDGYKVRWYCIGEGNAEQEYRILIKQYDVQNDYLLLGSQPNPFPYIKECDLYVQPSRYEGYCITLNEARCLNKPIITTNFTGAREQIRNGETGMIVPIDEEAIYRAVKKLIDNKGLTKYFSSQLALEESNTLSISTSKLNFYY